MAVSDSRPVVAVTMGDPAGVGAEVTVKGFDAAREHARPVVVGDAGVVREAVRACGLDHEVTAVDGVTAALAADGVPVYDLDNVGDPDHGVVREDYGRASLEYVETAIDLALAGEVDAIATAPINKQATRLAGAEHAGHTGLLAERTGTEEYAMMLIEEPLRVTHVSTHVPLREACDLVTTGAVRSTVRVTDEALRDLGIESPTVAVAGLNPHASDGGLLGDTEAEAIEPAVAAAREAGIDAVGPESPDTVFGRAVAGEFDCVVAMYHDQGHIPIKTLGAAGGRTVSGVNVTIGLPIVRTSVDHGTAFDIAGQGVASEASLVQAVETAARLARSRARSSDGGRR
jgi:4-hydroxythreonine-4-phosphate dehydrogenase